MKRWSIIIGAALIGAWLVISMMRDLFEAIPYFSSQPHRLLYVAGIAIAGGFVALGIDRLSPRAKRQVRVFAWGAAATTLTAFLVWFALSLASLSSFVIETDGGGWAAAALLLFAGIAVYLWFEFYRALKSGVSR